MKINFTIFMIVLFFLSGCIKRNVTGDISPAGFNHLKTEKSPYLRQHADNPIWWYTWGDEALNTAKKQNKLIFISIGYSTCHWCHVMERESYQDQEVANALNRNFIAIKVDREERPDVDSIYMDALQAMTGSGGWPLNVILTPDRKPFFAGTYFPKNQLISILQEISDAWATRPSEIQDIALKLGEWLKDQDRERVSADFSDEIFRTFFKNFQKTFDFKFGGKKGGPKFVPSYDLRVLLRVYRRTGRREALRMVETTLDHVSRGGIYDQLGGGFHRYSTDDHWLVPHFEKMLYDQASLVRSYLEAYQTTHNLEYRAVTEETLDYVRRDLTSPDGAFYSAEDADSNGQEGEFYTWKSDEIDKALSKAEDEQFSKAHGITKNGNFDGRQNILSLQSGFSRINRSVTVKAAIAKLKNIRATRTRPARDEKILTSWNGLMIAAFARAGRIFGRDDYIESAKKAMSVLIEKNKTSNGRLAHRRMGGEAKYDPVVDDYAFIIDALIELYEATFDSHWLAVAKRLQEEQDRLFFDSTKGNYFLTIGSDSNLLRRGKEFLDNVVPSGNSVTALNLLRLSDLLVESSFRERAIHLLKAFPSETVNAPGAFPQMLIALDYLLDQAKEIAIVGALSDSRIKIFYAKLNQTFNPNYVISIGNPNDSKLPLLSGRQQQHNAPTFYVCLSQMCKLPTNDPAKAIELVQQPKTYNLAK